jgi:RimJ/RimL family protein N-acetyltransferase
MDDALPAPEEIRTARLLLRKPCRQDAPLIFEVYAQDPEVTRYLRWRPHRDVGDSYDAIDRFLARWKTGSEFVWLLFLDTQLVGCVAARNEKDGVSLGYVLARRYWGKGYMPEAIRAVSDWALGNASVSRVWAECDIENHASARVLEKAGFVKESIQRKTMVLPNLPGEPRDCYRYGRNRI